MLPPLRRLPGPVDDGGRRAGRSSRSASVACSSTPGRSSTATRSAGAARRRSCSASSTTGSSRRDEIRQPMLDAQRDRRVDAAAVRQAHGRLAAQHGRLEHLAQALLRAAAAVLRVRVRRPERDRLARRARGARRLGSRRSAGAAPAVDRRRAHPLRAVRPRGRARSPRSATRGSTPASSTSRRSAGATRSGRSTDTRPARRPGSRAPTCRITRTGRSGSRPTGCRRCASRSGCGSTRSASWR